MFTMISTLMFQHIKTMDQTPDEIILALHTEGPQYFEKLSVEQTIHWHRLYFWDEDLFDNGVETYCRYIIDNPNTPVLKQLIQKVDKANGIRMVELLFTVFAKWSFEEQMTIYSHLMGIHLVAFLENDKLWNFKTGVNMEKKSLLGQLISNMTLDSNNAQIMCHFLTRLMVNTDEMQKRIVQWIANVFNFNLEKINLKTESCPKMSSDTFLAKVLHVLLKLWQDNLNKELISKINIRYLTHPDCPIKWMEKRNANGIGDDEKSYNFLTKCFCLLINGMRVVYTPILFRSVEWKHVIRSIHDDIIKCIAVHSFVTEFQLRRLQAEMKLAQDVYNEDCHIMTQEYLTQDVIQFYGDIVEHWLEHQTGIDDITGDMTYFLTTHVELEKLSYAKQLYTALALGIGQSKYSTCLDQRFAFLRICERTYVAIDNKEQQICDLIKSTLMLFIDIAKSNESLHDRFIMSNHICKFLTYGVDYLPMNWSVYLAQVAQHDPKLISNYLNVVISHQLEVYEALHIRHAKLFARTKYNVKKSYNTYALFNAVNNNDYLFHQYIQLIASFPDLKEMILGERHTVTTICRLLFQMIKVTTTMISKVDGQLQCMYITNADVMNYEGVPMDYHKRIGDIMTTLTKLDNSHTMGILCDELYDPDQLAQFKELFSEFQAGTERFATVLKHMEEYRAMEVEYKEDIPDEYLDPLTYVPIEEPVVLPEMNQCDNNVIMEKSNIIRYVLERGENPFTRDPLTESQLMEYNAQPEIQAKVAQFKENFQKWKTDNRM